MFERFDKQARTVILDARSEALVHADVQLEAEHLLLALARRVREGCRQGAGRCRTGS